MIELYGLSKQYHKPHWALSDITLHVERGDFWFITGPSGAGKTTLLQILGTLSKPDGGELFFNGKDVLAFSEKELAFFRNREIGNFIAVQHEAHGGLKARPASSCDTRGDLDIQRTYRRPVTGIGNNGLAGK